MARKRILGGIPDPPPREAEDEGEGEEEDDGIAPPPPAKKRRGKSKARRQYNKSHFFRAVPMKLNAVLDMQSTIGKRVFDLLNYVSFNITRIAHDAYILVDLH